MMMPRRVIILGDGEAPPKALRGRVARLGEKQIVLLGNRPEAGERLVGEFSVPPARSTRVPLDTQNLSQGVVVLSTLPNIRAHACHVQILGLEEMLPQYLPGARLCHVSSDGLDAWCEVDEYHPDLEASGHTLDGVDAATQSAFRTAFGVGVAGNTRIAHGLFLLVDGIFRLVHIPRQQMGTPHVLSFLRGKLDSVRSRDVSEVFQ